LYDKRGGAIEIEIKEDKQGFGLTKRNKKRYYAQQMIVLLSALAHNVVVWSREWLSEVLKIKRYGVLRMVRDVFHVCGFVELGAKNAIKRIVLSQAAAWARRCANSLRALLKQQHVRVTLGET
jgi:hypothetical protein